MSKVQEYLNKKAILKLPKIWIVESNKTGVAKPVEHQVVNVYYNVGYKSYDEGIKKNLNRYKIETGFPYDIDIAENETSMEEHGYGTGVGDLWAWSYFCSFSKEEAEEYYVNEEQRVKEKYSEKNDDETYDFIMPSC